jgi:hypothetical protein
MRPKRPFYRPPDPLSLKNPIKLGFFCSSLFTFRFRFPYHDNDLKLGVGSEEVRVQPLTGWKTASAAGKNFRENPRGGLWQKKG